jgi:hypothetical protein
MSSSNSFYASYNTGVGYNSLTKLTTGYQCTAIGVYSLYNNTSGYNNTAVGSYSLNSNTSGISNTAVGQNSLYNNSTGWFNSAVGQHSLYNNSTGNANTAVGNSSLSANTNGYNNSALGRQSLWANTSGYNNTAVGHSAGSIVTTGFNLTVIGYSAQPTSGSATNEITLGNSSVSILRCNTQTITSLSDVRDKNNIIDLTLGLDFITKLKPRQFNWDKREWYNDNKSDGSKIEEKYTAGFIAQELDDVQLTNDADWLNLVYKSNPDKLEATPGNLLPVIVKAIQELKEKNDKLESEIAKMKQLVVEMGVTDDNVNAVSLTDTN